MYGPGRPPKALKHKEVSSVMTVCLLVFKIKKQLFKEEEKEKMDVLCCRLEVPSF